tara:strand:+ start:321 stop:665 length:345 start_codon:yes stop_codon:yes gene_type:complete
MILNEVLLFFILIILCLLNIYYNYNKELLVLVVNLLLIAIYFIFSKRNKKIKKILFVAMIIFSVCGFFNENLIIKNTNLLKYKNNNTPIWLFSAYCIFFLGSIITYDYVSILIK